MKILRRSRNEIEDVWIPTKNSDGTPITAKDRARALFVLRGCIKLVRHPYDRSPHSGAGNCWCGRDPSSPIHQIVVDE